MGITTPAEEALRRAHQAAEAKDGLCLSTEYTRASCKMLWRCKEGHVWYAAFSAVVNDGSWCQACDRAMRKGQPRSAWTTTIWKPRAKKPTSHPVSDELKDLKDRPLTKAEKAAMDRILNRIPDDTSAIEGVDAEEQHELSKDENAFLRAHMPTRWRCTKGHEWDATFNAVKVHGFGCPECKAFVPEPFRDRIEYRSKRGPKGPRATPEEALLRAQIVAESHGGDCLSTHYTRVTDVMHWRCKHGHEWDAIFSSVVHNGSWCPTCSRQQPRNKRKGP